MYVTRPLSQLLKHPELLSQLPDGPNSGILVMKDEETQASSCFGWCKWTDTKIRKLPFPQNMDLNVVFLDYGCNLVPEPITFIPVLNRPLSSNRYYAIHQQGKHKGKAVTCNAKQKTHPMPLNPRNKYQQVDITHHGLTRYNVKFVACNGFSPYAFPRDQIWWVESSTPYQFELSDEARGIDSTLRARLPSLNCSLLCKSTKPVIVGKWYSPFMFVKEGRLRDQVERSMYYEITLEQRWEQVFTCKKNDETNSSSVITFDVEKEKVFIAGNKAMWSEKNVDDGWILFMSYETEGGDLSIGLRVEVVYRMKWEQKRGGWKNEKDWKVKIERDEVCKETRDWNEFGCYVLVERFNFRRTDGSLAMAYDFMHTHQIKTIWE